MALCKVELDIAINADEPEQLPTDEILSKLIEGYEVEINGELFDLTGLTDRLELTELQEAAQDQLSGEDAIRNLYIKEIEAIG